MRSLVVLSGGLDSAVCLGIALSEAGGDPTRVMCLSFDYGQRHRKELAGAAALARHYSAEHTTVTFDARVWGGSALTDDIPVPTGSAGSAGALPVTYVPARNIIFLSFALGVAEARGADAVYIGVNALDYSGYPDCRPEFIEAFRRVAAVGQKRGVEGRPVDIRTPLIGSSKAEIIRRGASLAVPFELTWSCYRGEERPCGDCDSCRLRERGFAEAGLADPALTEEEGEPL